MLADPICNPIRNPIRNPYAHTGRCPHRIALDPMVTYRKMRKMSLGVINLFVFLIKIIYK